MMDVAIKDKWLNLEAKCRLCKELLCCKEHRIAHEDKMHPVELRKCLTSLNNNLNITVSAINLGKSSRNESKASKEKMFKTPPTPASTRKRKRESASIPENCTNQHLLQSLGKKKKRSNILPHLRTPKENPKSPLAIINNGVKNEILVQNNTCGSATTASICLMKTSSPFTEGKDNDFISMTPIENRSPETMSIGSGGIQNNRVNITPEMSCELQVKKEPHGNDHNEMSNIDISGNSMEVNCSNLNCSIGNSVEFDEFAHYGTQINDGVSTDEIKPNTSSDEVIQKNESFTLYEMPSPTVQDGSLPLQLNSSDNFSNGSIQSGNLSGFQTILSPPHTSNSEPLKNENNCQFSIVTENSKVDSNKTMNEQNKPDETMDEIFMTPESNNESNNMSIDEFRTPSEWENSTSVLGKYDNKTPKCPAVYRTPKVLEHRISNIEEKMSDSVSTTAISEECNQANKKSNQIDECRFENRDGTILLKGSVKLQQISFKSIDPENLAILFQNPGNTSSKRDSGYQSLSDTSNMLSGNYSNRMASYNPNGLEEEKIPSESPNPSGISFHSDSSSPMHSRKNSDDLSCNISLRDCNIGEEFTFQLDPGMILDPGLLTDSNDRFISLNERLKNHPNINYDRRINLDFSFDVNKFGNESDLFFPTQLIEGENDVSIEISEQSMADENNRNTVVEDQSIIPNETIHSTVDVDRSMPDETIVSMAIEDQSIPYETIHDIKVVDQSMTDETLQSMVVVARLIPDENIHSTVVEEQSIPNETIHNTVVGDQSIPDETLHSTVVVDQSVLDENIHSTEVFDKSIPNETIHNTVVVGESELGENIHRTVVINLDKIDDAEIEEHIRRRDPIREYTTTLEMSRKLLHGVEGRGPYYSRISSSSIVPSLITLKKEPENEKSSAKENDQAKSSTCYVM